MLGSCQQGHHQQGYIHNGQQQEWGYAHEVGQQGHQWPGRANDGCQQGHHQAMSKMVVKLTNCKEETTAGTKPESANKETRPSLYTSTS